MMKRRNGVSLLEVGIAGSLCSVIVTLAMAATHRALRLESNLRTTDELLLGSQRLADQFRNDVHEAIDVTVFEPGGKSSEVLRMRFGDQRIALYTMVEREVDWTLSDGQGQTLRREVFILPEMLELSFTTQLRPQRVQLRLSRESPAIRIAAADPMPTPGVLLSISAVVGRNRRFLHPAAKE